jgi:hypothetical protein
MPSTTGLILELPQPYLNFIGGIGGYLPDILPSGDWEAYLPEFENQAKLGLETMNCVQFSRLNACEISANFYGLPLNLSDRFLYWASGCTAQGNTFSKCDAGLHLYGAPSEEKWPWLEVLSRDQYGVQPPADVLQCALKILSDWEIGKLVWVPSTLDSLKAALKKGPIWFCNDVHAMVIYRIDDQIRVFDTYGTGKGAFPLDYAPQIFTAYLAPFTPKHLIPPPMYQFKENDLYQVVEGKGGFMLFAAGRLYYDDVAKLLASWSVRNNGRTEGKVGVLQLKDLVGVPLFNLKNEPVEF